MIRLRAFHVRWISTERLLVVLAQFDATDPLRPALEAERERRRAEEQRRSEAQSRLVWGTDG